MMFSAKEMIKQRKSIRTFDGKSLSDADRKSLEDYINKLTNPFDIPVEFQLLDARENGLTSPVIVGENSYLAAKVKKEGAYEIAFGYSFEKACLYAQSLGLGTVMLAASLSRSTFEEAMKVQNDEVLPAASPIGYSARKKSMRETLMRKGLKADERLPYETLFFDLQYGQPLPQHSCIFSDALEMVRWAPSAANKQPWRVVVDGECVHFYEEKSMNDSPLGDIQKVDVGIALSHFDLTMKENAYNGKFYECDPQIKTPENVQYITSYRKTP